MNSGQRLQIRDLVKKYSDSGTESLVVFVAETDGMLAACQELLRSLETAGATSAASTAPVATIPPSTVSSN